jgi:hypothetical protein
VRQNVVQQSFRASRSALAKTTPQGQDNASGLSAATVFSVTRRGPPLVNFNPNRYGKQRSAHQNGGNKSTHLQTPTLLMVAIQAAQVWSELLMMGRR